MSFPRRPAFTTFCATLCALGLSSVAAAQSFDVTVNSTSSAPGVYANANLYQASCDGDAGTEWYLVTLQWTPESNPQVFVDNAADCNTGNQVTNDAGVLISSTDTGNEVTHAIPILPSSSSLNYGVGDGNIQIDLRQVMGAAQGLTNSAYTCSPPSQGTAYVCVTQTQFAQSTLSTTQEVFDWYMQFNWDTFTPDPPIVQPAITGDSNVTLSWAYSSTELPSNTYNVWYIPDPGAGPPDANGNCGASSFTPSGKQLIHARKPREDWSAFDGGCPDPSEEDSFGACCTDAGTVSLSDGGGEACVDVLTPTVGPAANNSTGLCQGCQSDGDCGQSAICVADSLTNRYCTPACTETDGGEAPECPVGFLCTSVTSVDGTLGNGCVPPANLCLPAATLCDACTSTCGDGGICVASADGGPSFCMPHCSDGGVNLNGTGSCLGDTSCSAAGVQIGSFTYPNVCAPTSGGCYDPTPLSVVLAGGDPYYVDAGTSTADAGPPAQVALAGWSGPVSFPSTDSSGQINGLQNGQCYDFVVQTVLADGTLGYTSTPVVQAPIKNYDFWRLYQGSGGQDQGGLHCQSAGGAAGLCAIAAAGLSLLRRRRRDRRAGSSGGSPR